MKTKSTCYVVESFVHLKILAALVIICVFVVANALAQDESNIKSDQPSNAEIESFFDSFADAIRDEEDYLHDYFATDAMVIAALKTRDKTDVPVDERKKLGQRLRSRFCNENGRWPLVYAWDIHDIQNIEISDNIATVDVRQWYDEFEFYNKYRWHLVKDEEGNWKAFDFQDMDRGIKLSTILGVGSRIVDDNPDWLRQLSKVFRRITSVGQEYLLEDHLEPIQDDVHALLQQDLPDDTLSFLYTLKIEYLLYIEEYEEAMSILDEMEGLEESYPCTQLFRGEALYMVDQIRESIDCFKEYVSLYDDKWDAHVCEIMSDMHREIGEMDQAIELAERGLADRPSAWGCLASLAVALPVERKAEMNKHIAAEGNTEEVLDFVVDWSIELGDDVAALHAFGLLKKHHPNSELIDLYDSYFDK